MKRRDTCLAAAPVRMRVWRGLDRSPMREKKEGYRERERGGIKKIFRKRKTSR